MAGLEVRRIINEPTAAAIAYGLGACRNTDTADDTEITPNSSKAHGNSDGSDAAAVLGEDEKRILVFDLGGGTFDISLLSVSAGLFQVLATAGDTHLGGEDLDQALMGHLLAVFSRSHRALLTDAPIDPASPAGARALRRLKAASERVKRALSAQTLASVEIDAFWGGADLKATVTRARFQALCAGFFARCIAPLDGVLADARVSKGKVDEVVLIGGSTRIPKVRELITAYFDGRAPNTSVNPDEAVAYGAAVQAAMLAAGGAHSGEAGDTAAGGVADMLLVDVAPLSLGVETAGGVMSVVIPRNTEVPYKTTKYYSTDRDGQRAVDVSIYEGERPQVADNHFLGKFSLEGLPDAPAGVLRVKVTFALDENGLLAVSAVEESTNTRCAITIANDAGAGRLTAAQVSALVAEAEQFRLQDAAARAVSVGRLRCEALAAQVTAAAAALAARLSAADVTRLTNAVEDCKAWLVVNRDANRAQYEGAFARLDKACDGILNRAYAEHVAAGGEVPSSASASTSAAATEAKTDASA